MASSTPQEETMNVDQQLQDEIDEFLGRPAARLKGRAGRALDPVEQFTFNTPELAAAKLVTSVEHSVPVWVNLDDIGAYLRATREEYGMSLGDMQEETGMSRGRLSRLENRVSSNPTVLTLSRIASAMDLRIMVTLCPLEVEK